MEKTLLQSPIIMDLQEKIQQGNYSALQEFWDMIENKGAPLIEEINGESDNNLVTFIYKSDKKIKNVVLIPPVGRDKYLENKLEQIMDTNLWYITYKVKNNLRFKYSFSVNDSLDIDCEKRWDNLMYDKLNKNILVFKNADGSDDDLDSYVVMPNVAEHIWVKNRNNSPKGKLFEHELHSENLETDRRIRIYTPYGYKEDINPYKFLVLTDGDEYINVLSATTVLDNLIADEKIPPIVTIFIDATETREEELSCSDTFSDIIIKDLMPWVRNNYNISNNPQWT